MQMQQMQQLQQASAFATPMQQMQNAAAGYPPTFAPVPPTAGIGFFSPLALPAALLKRPRSPTTVHPIVKKMEDAAAAKLAAACDYWVNDATRSIVWGEPLGLDAAQWVRQTSAPKVELSACGWDASQAALAAALEAQASSAAANAAFAGCAANAATKVLLDSAASDKKKHDSDEWAQLELALDTSAPSYTPLPLLEAVALLQLDWPYDLRGRVRRTFEAIERECDVNGKGRIELLDFCNAVEETIPQQTGVIRQRERRVFLARFFRALQRMDQAWMRVHPKRRRDDVGAEWLPFSAACLGMSVLVLCPIPALTPRIRQDTVDELHRITVSHRWRMSAGDGERVRQPQFQDNGTARPVSKEELTYLFACVLAVEPLFESSSEIEEAPLLSLADAMASAMMPTDDRLKKLAHEDFWASVVDLPVQLHPDIEANLEESRAFRCRDLEDIVAHPPAPAARTLGVPAWWDHSTPEGAHFYYNPGTEATTWDMPKSTWVGAIDDGSGAPYRYHTKTTERQWITEGFRTLVP